MTINIKNFCIIILISIICSLFGDILIYDSSNVAYAALSIKEKNGVKFVVDSKGNTVGKASLSPSLAKQAEKDMAKASKSSSSSGSSSGSSSSSSKSSKSSTSSSSKMSDEEYTNAIDECKQRYYEAQAKGDKEGMSKAHADAEKIRLENNPNYVPDTEYYGGDTRYVAAKSSKKSDKSTMEQEKNKLVEMLNSGNASQVAFAKEQMNYYGMSLKEVDTKTVSLIAQGKDLPKLDANDPRLQGNNPYDPVSGQYKFLGVDANGNFVTNPDYPNIGGAQNMWNRDYLTTEDIALNKQASNLIGLNNSSALLLTNEDDINTLATKFLEQNKDWAAEGWTVDKLKDSFVFQQDYDGVATLRGVHQTTNGHLYYKSYAVNTTTTVPVYDIDYTLATVPDMPTGGGAMSNPPPPKPPSDKEVTNIYQDTDDEYIIVEETWTEEVPVFTYVEFRTELNASCNIRIMSTGEVMNIGDGNSQSVVGKIKSGYGIYVEIDSDIDLTCSEPGFVPPPEEMDQISNPTKAWIEFNGTIYNLETSTTNDTDWNWSRKFATPVNQSSPLKNRVIYIPTDLPDGLYDIKVGIEGARSPVGTMNKYLDARIEIDDHMYVDDNTGVR